MALEDTVGLYLSAALVIFVYSMFLYKDNPFFHIAEHLALAVALANATVVAIKSLQDIAWTPGIIQGKDTLFWAFALVFGALTLTRLSKGYGWLSRWPLSFVVGSGIGLGLRGAVETQLMRNISTAILPLFGGTVTPLDNLVTLVFTASTVAYFLITVEHKGPWGIVAKMGRYSMMVAFGAQYGSVMITRLSGLGTRVIIILQALGLA